MKVVPLRTQVESLHEWYCWSQCRFTLLKDSSLVAGIFIFPYGLSLHRKAKLLQALWDDTTVRKQGKWPWEYSVWCHYLVMCRCGLLTNTYSAHYDSNLSLSCWHSFFSPSIVCVDIWFIPVVAWQREKPSFKAHLVTWSALINNIIYTF